jgi:hypothetical protein
MDRFNERFGAALNAARYVTSSQRLRFQHLFNSRCDASRITLRIMAYDRAHLPDEVTGTMVETVRRIFRRSGIEVEWITGELSDPEGSYQVYDVKRGGHEHEDACRARRDIALCIFPASPPTLPRGVLGMALPLSRSGLNVKLYADRVRFAADSENTPYATVLAHVVAHEVGHVLLRASLHSARGLMSDTWTAHEYELMKSGSLLFLPAYTIKMRSMASGEACAVPNETYADAKNPQPAAAAPKPTLAKAQK